MDSSSRKEGGPVAAVSLLVDTAHELAILREARQRYRARLAPDFSPLAYDPTDEMRLSRLLADLLDPDGTHGQGGRFLAAFLSDVCKFPEVDLAGASVTTEEVIPGGRRPDVVIRLRGMWIVIENKPWAGDQPGQVAAYAEWLSKSGRPWLVLYLTAGGTDPSEHSVAASDWTHIKESSRGRSIAYNEDVARWLETCVGLCESERVRFFLGELREFLRAHFDEVTDMATENAIVKVVLEKPGHLERVASLEAAIRIGNALPVIKERLLRDLARQVSELAEGAGMRAVTSSEKTLNCERFAGMSIDLATDRGLTFSWEFQQGGCNGAAFGIGQPGEPIPYEEALVAALNQKFQPGKQGKSWLWVRNIDNPSWKNWSSSPDPWLGILTTDDQGRSETARFIVDKAAAIREIIREVRTTSCEV